MKPVQSISISFLLQAFRSYLATLRLSQISRKLYLGDIKRFLSQLEDSLLTPDHLTHSDIYLSYLKLPEIRASKSLARRHLASLRQFGIFLATTYNLPNPTSNLTLFTNSTPKDNLLMLKEKYIKTYIDYLNSQQLSFSTIKSYKSDLSQYLTYLASIYPSNYTDEVLNEKNIKKYLINLSQLANSSPATLSRKEKSLSRFQLWMQSNLPQLKLSDSSTNSLVSKSSHEFSAIPSSSSPNFPSQLSPASNTPVKDNIFVKIFNSRINKVSNLVNTSVRSYISLAILLLFITTLGIFAYRQFASDTRLISAYPSTPVTPNRQLSFQGRLETTSGTPITSATNFTFKLFTASSGGTELYSTGNCSITPDNDGVFSTQIGDTCGAGIPSTVFTENQDVWLEVTVASETLTPRQQIATVAYALNSETLQGFPISSTVSAIRNTVVPMNQWGEIIVGEQSPKLTGVSGTFAISAPALSLTTTTGTNGNITLAPDGTGQVNLQGNTTTTNFFNVSNAQLSTGSLITGTVANGNTGFKLIDLLSGSSPTSKFSVTDLGNTTIAGDLTISGDDLIMSTNTAGMLLIADGTNFNPTAVSGDITINSAGVTAIGADKITETMLKAIDSASDEECLTFESTVGDFEWQSCGSGGASSWTDAGSYLYPNDAEVLGNSASGGTNKIAGIYLADSAPLVFGTNNNISFSFSGNTLGSTLTAGSMIGIGTTTALATLDVRGSLGSIPVASFSGITSQATMIVNQDGVGDIFTASKSGDTKFVINNAGNVGIGIANPTNKLEIGGSTSTISNGSGDITIDSASNNISLAGDSLINILNGYFSGELGVGISDAIGTLHVHGATVGKALAIFNELGDQALFTASSSGITKYTLANNGDISTAGTYFNFGLTSGTSGYGFRDNGGIMEYKNSSGNWVGIGSGSGGSYWDQTLGTLQPYNATVDLLIGGTATSSAKFGLINVNSGTPTATISGSTAGNALYLTGDGILATSNNRTLQINPIGGNVGIGVSNPTEKLEVNGYIVAQRFVDSAGSGAYYLDPASTSNSLYISGDIVSDNSTFTISSTSNQNITLDAGSGTVSIGSGGAGKLDAGTIDPPYTINGQKFATYMASMTGVKEETTGVVSTLLVSPNVYRATLDLKNAPVGSDLWLFRRVTNLPQNLDQLVILLSTTSSQSWYTIDAENGLIHLYTNTPARVSYRLTAPRYDADQWTNQRSLDSASIGHVIETTDIWDTTAINLQQIIDPALLANEQNKVMNLATDIISPLATSSAITITAPMVIQPSYHDVDLPILSVDGEIEATTISARTAHLDTLEVKNIIADHISVNQIEGLDAKIASLSAGTTQELSDSEIETITERIKSRLTQILDPATAQDITPPPEATASSNLILHDASLALTPVSTDAANLTSLDTDLAIVNNYLAVIGTATITSLDVTSNLYTAKIASKTGILTLGDNTLIVDSTTGQVMVNGDFLVSGTILADNANLNSLTIGTPATPSALANLLSIYNEQGESVATINASGSTNLAELTTNMITIASSKSASDSSGLAELLGTTQSNATAGEGILLSPNTELTIASQYVTTHSLVYLTPTTNTDNKVLFVKSKTTCPPPTTHNSLPINSCTPSFTVGIDAPASSDISFNWWIIQLASSQENSL